MPKIPRDLVKSLMELGLLESEAKIYITLSMLNTAEVKKLINFLGLSKPNTYESLRLLEEKGLVVLINNRPMTYQAIPHELGLEILLETHLNAKKQAEKLFSTLDQEKFREKSRTLWYVLSEKGIDHKIKDMLKNARQSIFMASPPKYLKYFKKLNERDLKLELIIYSDNKDTEDELEKIFQGKEGDFSIIATDKMINGFATKHYDKEELKTAYKEAFYEFGLEDLMLLVVDDSEMLYVMPMTENSSTAINTKNKALITLSKIGFRDILPNKDKQ